MAPVQSLNKKAIVKKRTKKFIRHQADMFMRIGPKSGSGWRKPKGIDGRVRRRFKGAIPMPSVGYGSNKKTRNLMPNGFQKCLVNNVAELEMLMMHNRKFCAEIGTSCGRRTRAAIIERAEQLAVRVTNAGAKVEAVEEE